MCVLGVADHRHRRYPRTFEINFEISESQKLKFVKVTGSTKFPGQRVSKDYVLKNNDVIEIYS